MLVVFIGFFGLIVPALGKIRTVSLSFFTFPGVAINMPLSIFLDGLPPIRDADLLVCPGFTYGAVRSGLIQLRSLIHLTNLPCERHDFRCGGSRPSYPTLDLQRRYVAPNLCAPRGRTYASQS